MISKKLLEALNEQMNFEFSSAHLYLCMAAYCENTNMPGSANFFIVQAEEERFHAMRFFEYLSNMDGNLSLKNITETKNEYDSLLTVYKEALEHERKVTSRVYDLMKTATEENEFATISFLKWFVDEQTEEEMNIKNILLRLEQIQSDPYAVYMFDQEQSQRVFTPPVIN